MEDEENAAVSFDSKLLLKLDDRRIEKIISGNLSRPQARKDLFGNEESNSIHYTIHNYQEVESQLATRDSSHFKPTKSCQMVAINSRSGRGILNLDGLVLTRAVSCCF